MVRDSTRSLEPRAETLATVLTGPVYNSWANRVTNCKWLAIAGHPLPMMSLYIDYLSFYIADEFIHRWQICLPLCSWVATHCAALEIGCTDETLSTSPLLPKTENTHRYIQGVHKNSYSWSIGVLYFTVKKPDIDCTDICHSIPT